MAAVNRVPVIYKLAALILALLVGCAIFAPVIAPYDPNQVLPDETLQACSGTHWLGTDALGRDVFSRILYGAQVSIGFAVTAALCTMLLGISLGIIGGYFGGAADTVIQLLVNIFQGLPGMSLMIAIAGAMGPGTASLLLAITLTSWAGFSRIVRGEVLKIREENYIEAVRSLGGGTFYILLHYILPNLFNSLIILFTVRIGTVVLSVASLSFLGLGLQPPQADWGVMIQDAKTYFRSYPNLLLAPGLCIMALCASIQLVGDALRDRFSIRKGLYKQDW
ncbi:ABC transporter permease [Sporomusa acidovorans]|uniref:Glutathione transport system permease protein GsiD n=1 Tax=Sporomusa acidovorans (strain ATCC 49682 / DSM 3132 / Mol) TaxID=1123286 RepID=A0ABZ3J5C1_SPOA4|nr:ABC transporter permease [Sporomusa acidovorans]OZC23949.1 glutathione transport system permease protein GsiD [Sporomusa acidovorans DSM 3132]SDF31911.1 peptide/nickel transport system permease protein [Sporomusa acidovorans]